MQLGSRMGLARRAPEDGLSRENALSSLSTRAVKKSQPENLRQSHAQRRRPQAELVPEDNVPGITFILSGSEKATQARAVRARHGRVLSVSLVSAGSSHSFYFLAGAAGAATAW